MGSKLEKGSLGRADETRQFPQGKIEVVKLEAGTIGRGTFQPGWRWSECIRPLVGTPSCRLNHFGLVVSGRMGVRLDDGTEMEFGAGDALNIPPGHDAWVVGKEPCVAVDITGAESYAQVLER